jgi:hypothetical protein
MVKHILLKLDNDKFFALKQFKVSVETLDKKNMSWEKLLCDWILNLVELASKKEIDSMVDGVLLSLKPEAREGFEIAVKMCINQQLRYLGKT